jgi:hypothetical protein
MIRGNTHLNQISLNVKNINNPDRRQLQHTQANKKLPFIIRLPVRSQDISRAGLLSGYSSVIFFLSPNISLLLLFHHKKNHR